VKRGERQVFIETKSRLGPTQYTVLRSDDLFGMTPSLKVNFRCGLKQVASSRQF
jgi:hypothetical protein